MATKRIDQLTAHPKTAANPLTNLSEIVLRDAALASNNTRKGSLADVTSYEANVLNFGADNQNGADSTAAIQAAIDYVHNLSGGVGSQGCVYVPPGIYRITQLFIPEGIQFRGAGIGPGGTWLVQDAVVGDLDAILQAPYTVSAQYIHYTILRDFVLSKGGANYEPMSALPVAPNYDTYGNGILFDSMCGEGTKFQNIRVQNFPTHGIHVTGAVTCWFQDLHLFNNGYEGLYLQQGGGHSWTGHYVLGISGDNNGITQSARVDEPLAKGALVGVDSANVWITGMKSEKHFCQEYAVNCYGDNTHNWLILNAVTHTGGNETDPPDAFVRIVNQGVGYQVWIQGMNTHPGGGVPANIIRDELNSSVIDYTDDPATRNFMTYYSAYHGNEYMHLQANGGWIRANPGVDPVVGGFAMGGTNGVGLGASGNVTALAKGAATNAPTSLVVNRWIYATVNGVTGWVPFFV